MDSSRQLTTIMMELVSEHEHLLRLGREKQQVLVRNDVQALQRLVQDELKAVQQVERLELRRQRIIQKLADSSGGFFQSGIRLQDILAKMPPSPEKERLEGLAQSLRRLLEELQQVNEQNRQLVEQALLFVHSSMELFAASDGIGTMYDKQAKTHEPLPGTGLSWLDRKI